MEYKSSNAGIWYSRDRKETELELCEKYGITDIVNTNGTKDGQYFKGCKEKIHRVLYITLRDSGEYQFIVNFHQRVEKEGVKCY